MKQASPIRVLGLVLRYLAPLLVVLAGAYVAKVLIAGRTAPPRSEPPPRLLPVETISVEISDRDRSLEAWGTVRPVRRVVLRPTVTGPVVEVHPDLLAGGRVEAGAPLVRIDPRDYDLGVALARADVAGAEADLEVERGNASVAARELELLAGDLELDEAERRLALREPVVAQREAALQTARTQLERAELDLERTAITAPFDALVLDEDVEVGTDLRAGTQVATLVDTSVFLVEVSVPLARLGALRGMGAPARVWPADGSAPLDGVLARISGEVEPTGRTALVQVEVADPLDARGGAPLLLGSFVRVELPLATVPSAAAIPRGALREGDEVWLVDEDGRLEIRGVVVALRSEGEVLVTEGLDPGDVVVTSSISVPVPGMRLEPIGAAAPPAEPGARPAAADPVDDPASGASDGGDLR